MTILQDSLVIPNDVAFVPVNELPDRVRDQLEWTNGDIAVTRLQSRSTTKIVNSDFADLLKQFQDEKTIVEAVLRYSARKTTDPKQMLNDAFPLLQQFVESGLLVPPGHEQQAVEPTLQRGDQVDSFTIVRRIRTLQDTEIYQAQAADGQPVAIKIKQPQANEQVGYMLHHEAQILQTLGGVVTPQLVSEATWMDRPYLAIEWCAAVDVTHRARELADQPLKLLQLCIGILEAYAQLHENGVMHGDIHPGNILVDNCEVITLIDFGMASSNQFPLHHRAGVAFYYEPEYATAFLEKRKPPPASPAGEQYALAALIYQLITGATYIDFSLEEDLLYRQILEELPKSFASRNLAYYDIAPWPAVEKMLQKALAKDPEERFDSVADFSMALKKAVTAAKATENNPKQPNRITVRPETTAFVEDLHQQLSLDGSLLEAGLPRSPYASVKFGSAGIAYVLYRMACNRQDPELLTLADLWLTRAEAALGDEAGFYNPDLDMSAETIGPSSIFHSPSGVFVTRALLALASGDRRSLYHSLAGFVEMGGLPCENLDITLGKAGVLLAGAMLCEQLHDPSLADQSSLTQLGNRLIEELWETIDQYGPMGRDCALKNLGIAHGWAGLLYATLRWHEATQVALPTGFQHRLKELAALAEPTGRGKSWPWELGLQEESMAGWCNGSAGYVYLWSAAFRVLGNSQYLQLAIDAGWHAWEEQSAAYSLCCGLAGRSYSLLELYSITKDEAWLTRANELANQAAYHANHSQLPDYEGFEMSLYKGELGVALLLDDLKNSVENLQGIQFPFFF